MSAVGRLPIPAGELVEGPWPDRSVRSARGPLAELGGLVLIGALVPLHGAWIVQAIILALLFVVPGALVVRALRIPRPVLAAFPVYVPAASLALLSFVGLAVDGIGLAAGVDEPLRAVPLLIGLAVTCAVLVALGRRAPADAGVAWALPSVHLAEVWPLVLPLVAAAGAFRLTNGHDGATALVALLLTIAALVFGLVGGDRLSVRGLRLLAFGVGLSLVWSFSLRGSFVFGYDIATEFHVLESTLSSGSWHAAHRDDAYGAMLSLTVLPALLHALGGASALLLLKAVYPVLFALFAVGLLDLARRYVSGRYALVAVAVIVTQSYFFQQMPAIARQEIALLLFVAFTAALLEPSLRRGPAIGLVTVLGLGMVVSHYSTTYLAVGMCAIAVVLGLLLRTVGRPAAALGLIACALVVIGVGSGVWYGAVTKSTSNVTTFADNLRSQGLQILPTRGKQQGLLSTYLNGNTSTKVSPARYQALIKANYAKNRPWVHPLPVGSDPRFALQGASLGVKGEQAPGLGGRLLATLATQLLNLLAVVAVLYLLIARGTSPRMRNIALLGASTLAALTVLRLSGTAASAYNQERAFVQSMVLLSIAIAVAVRWLAGSGRLRRGLTLAAVVAGFVAVIAGTSGLRGHVFGGGNGAVNLANSGEDYERFYSRTSELSAAQWLQASVRPGELRYADTYGQLRVLAGSGSGFGLMTAVTPQTLDRHAWVYGSTTNLVSEHARGTLDRNFALYQWPSAYLNTYYNKVFSNGGATVYHR